MTKIKTITGNRKWLVNQQIKLVVFFYFTYRLLAGEIKPKYYIRFLMRLLFFLSKMNHNKYVMIGKRLKINLYVPGYPSRAFFNACRKVNEFEDKMPCVTALVSITSACRFNCEHCYQKYDKGKDIGIEYVLDTVKKMQDNGVAFFNIEGGEPFLVFDRLKAVCDSIDMRSEILINSTGDGMTYDKLVELRKNKNLIGIMFSLHTDEPDKLNHFMGRDDAWDKLVNGINMCHQAGIAVMFNTCLLKPDFSNGRFEKIMDLSKQFNGAILQLIKPKPAGGWLESGADRFDASDIARVKEKVKFYNLNEQKKNYPFISCMLNEEDKSLFGCTAGGTDRFYINAKGDVQPCEFLNLSFGNLKSEDFEVIYSRMREEFHVPGDCLLCEKYSRKILNLFREHKLNTLPLSCELSKLVYKDWDRGEPADFYKKVEEI
jgi:MoaA/NifB/PqqE/SkfB family radical SAM enzyme